MVQSKVREDHYAGNSLAADFRDFRYCCGRCVFALPDDKRRTSLQAPESKVRKNHVAGKVRNSHVA